MDMHTDTNTDDLMLEQLAPGEEQTPVEPKRDDSYQNAKEHMEETFAQAAIEKQRKEQKWLGYLIETLLSAVLYLAIKVVFSTANALTGVPETLQLIACLAPVLIGMGLRLVKERLPLGDAASECKIHFIAAAVLLVVDIVRLVIAAV